MEQLPKSNIRAMKNVCAKGHVLPSACVWGLLVYVVAGDNQHLHGFNDTAAIWPILVSRLISLIQYGDKNCNV